MQKKFHFFILICLFLIYNGSSVAQVKDSTITDGAHTSKTETKVKLSIAELRQILFSPLSYDPYTSHINKEVLRITSDNYDQQSGTQDVYAKKLSNFEAAKKNLLDAIQLQPKMMPAAELGVLGDLFIYANAAAAGYALYQHLKKYHNEY